ncbi:MAG TPA: hypothetical protein PLR86_06740 [Planctomycetota bacterium]|nr:hypothetical protein [Planctomycetota bacterium]
MHRNALDYVEMREYVEIRGLFFALGRNSGEFTLNSGEFTLGKICSGEKKKIGKKGENFANFRKNWRDFGKNRGNFRRFCSEKKAILKAIGRIF